MNKKLGASLLSLGLMLDLAVPVNAWTLFPIREKIVKEKETDYVVTSVVGAITLVVSLVAGKLIFGHNEKHDYNIRNNFLTYINTQLRKYNVHLTCNNSQEEIKLYMRGKDFLQARQTDVNTVISNVLELFNTQFNPLGLYMIESLGEDRKFEICFGDPVSPVFSEPLNEEGIASIVRLLQNSLEQRRQAQGEGEEDEREDDQLNGFY
jgi:hypothetical protein